MNINELYEFYGKNWVTMSRELKLGSTTIQNWRKKGFIPIRSQLLIEKLTQGRFVAKFEDGEPN